MTDNLVRRRGWKWGAFVIAVTCFGLGVADVSPVPTVEIHWIEKSRSEAGLYMPSYEYKREWEIMLVYIGSSSCGFANIPEMPVDPRRLLSRRMLSTRLNLHRLSFTRKLRR